MKSRGFTLTEILAVIVILAILVGIGTPVYYTISNNTRNNEYKTKKDYLKAQAIKYAEENNIEVNKTITASTLVQAGFVVADDYVEEDGEEIPFITNPVDSEENLACRIINITIDGYDRNAEVTDDSNCDLVLQEVLASSLGIRAFKYSDNKLGKELYFEASDAGSFEWSNMDVALVVSVNTDSFISGTISHDGDTQEIDSTNIMSDIRDGATVRSSDSNVLVVSAITILKDTVGVSIQSREGSDSVAKSTSVEVKIDKEEPIISSTSYSGWTNKNSDGQKSIAVYVSDGNGSGPKYVYLTKNSNASEINDKNKYSVNEFGQATVDHGYQGNNESNVPLLENGDYYVWAEDKVENRTTKPNKVVVTNVDNNPPTCRIRVYDNGSIVEQINHDGVTEFNYTKWTRNPITISYGCLDEESGCKIEKSGATKEFNNISVGVFHLDQYVISDNAGNEVTCYAGGIDVDVYHDTIPPEECPIGGEKTTWTSSPVTITYGCVDYGIGCNPSLSGGSRVYQSDGVTTTIKQTVLPEYTVADKLGNTKTCYPGGKTIDVYYDKTPPIINPKVNPLGRNNQNYNTLDNIEYSDPDSGIKSVSCSPANTSEKGNKGTYDVKCTAIDNVGNSASTTYKIQHQFDVGPTYMTSASLCGTHRACDSCSGCCANGTSGWNCTCGPGQEDTINCPGSCWHYQGCDPCQQECNCRQDPNSCNVYVCPNGTHHSNGSAYSTSDKTCYY